MKFYSFLGYYTLANIRFSILIFTLIAIYSYDKLKEISLYLLKIIIFEIVSGFESYFIILKKNINGN